MHLSLLHYLRIDDGDSTFPIIKLGVSSRTPLVTTVSQKTEREKERIIARLQIPTSPPPTQEARQPCLCLFRRQ